MFLTFLRVQDSSQCLFSAQENREQTEMQPAMPEEEAISIRLTPYGKHIILGKFDHDLTATEPWKSCFW